jgi:predicted aconitase
LALDLSPEQRSIASGSDGAAMAMRIVAESARLLGAPRLIPIASAHIDGALYHGDSGTLFAERLVAGGAKVAVRATLNVGALDLMGCSKVRLEEPQRGMARRMMEAYRKLGCEPSWTCAPYQAGHRPVRAATSPGANPMPSCSAIRFWARAPTAMATFST